MARKFRKVSKAHVIKVRTGGNDAGLVSRLFKEKDTERLGAMGAKLKAVPLRCYRPNILGKPSRWQDRRSWRETRPKKASSAGVQGG